MDLPWLPAPHSPQGVWERQDKADVSTVWLSVVPVAASRWRSAGQCVVQLPPCPACTRSCAGSAPLPALSPGTEAACGCQITGT